MKKYFVFFSLMLLAGKIFGQLDTVTSNTSIKTNYLKKSKTQKTIAWALLVTGTTLMIIGSTVGNHAADDLSFNEAAKGGSLIIAGALMDAGSIPLFIAGAKNKRRAMAVTIRNHVVPRLQQGTIARVSTPAMVLKIRL